MLCFDMYNAVIENRVNLKFADIPISPNQKNYIALVDLKSYFNFIVNDEGDVRKSFSILMCVIIKGKIM